jgi:copper(I)-binding protein
MRKKPGLLMLIVGAALALGGCGGGSAEAITVSDPWVRASPSMARAGAAYMVLANHTNQDDRLLSAVCDAAATVELHESREEGGMMSMMPVQAITVPANGQAELKPGGLHIMLIDLNRELVEGESVTLTLNFERAGAVTVSAPIRAEP